ILDKRNVEPLAIGSGLLVRERQTAERFRQDFSCVTLRMSSRACDQVICANFLPPNADFDWLSDAAPSVSIGGDQDLTSPTAREIRFERVRIDGIIVDEENAVALIAQPLHHSDKYALLVFVRADPAEAQSECDEIGAHR